MAQLQIVLAIYHLFGAGVTPPSSPSHSSSNTMFSGSSKPGGGVLFFLFFFDPRKESRVDLKTRLK